MKILEITTFIVLVISIKADKVLDDSIYKPDSILYTAKNDIVDIHFAVGGDEEIFIVERQHNRSFKGLYALKTAMNADGLIATKILDNGQCTTSDDKTIFFGTSDGIYTYNVAEKKAQKYGNITADIKAIQKDSKKDVIYIIADDQLSKVTEKGTKMKKIASYVQQVVLDEDNNIYFYKSDAKKFKVVVDDKITEINGLPEFNQIKLIRSFASSEGVIVMLNKRMYRAFSNGSIVRTEFVFNNVPTALHLDLGVIQMFGYNKQLYQFNIIGLVLQGLSSAFGKFYTSLFENLNSNSTINQ